MKSMDSPEITSFCKHSLLPSGREKKRKVNTYLQPGLKGAKDSLQQIVEVNPWQFRSVVKHRTGQLTIDIEGESDPLMLEIVKQSKAYDNMIYFLTIYKKLECLLDISQECIDCLVYLSLFPKDYVIDRDTIIQLWMADGLIKEEPVEGVATAYLKALCKHGECLSILTEDDGTGKMWYKIKSIEISEQVIKISNISPLRLISEDPTSVLSAETESSHVTLQSLFPKDFQALGRFSKIRMLLLFGKHKGNVESIPYDFFISLQYLRALDLSKTNLSELPSSIGNARCLRYLDLSETLIKRIPETIEFLQKLQTLKLQNCRFLVSLPKNIRKLTCLQHLDLGTLHRIRSMPAGMGALSCLRTLSGFIAGKEHGCRITELKNMNYLGGSFCLSKLENVSSLEEAKEANLGYKKRLKYLELQWTDDDFDEDQDSIGVEYEVMKYLQPHTNLQDLRILCYAGSIFPSWISHPSFGKLTKITIFKCANCQVLPSLGQLPSLESLSLIELTEVRIIDVHFRKEKRIGAADNDYHFVAFPALQDLEIDSMLKLEKWSDKLNDDFPRLRNFSIRNCPKLTALPELKNIRLLQYLELNQCTQLTSLPDGGLPASLETLVIENCPSFNCSMEERERKVWVTSQKKREA